MTRIALVATRKLNGDILYEGATLAASFPNTVLSATPVGAAAITALTTAAIPGQPFATFDANDLSAGAASYQVDVQYDDGAGGQDQELVDVDVIVVPPLALLQDGACELDFEWTSAAELYWGSLSLDTTGATDLSSVALAVHYVGAAAAGDFSEPTEVEPVAVPAGDSFGGANVVVAYRLHSLDAGRIDVFPAPLTAQCGAAWSPALPVTMNVSAPATLDLDTEGRPIAAPTADGPLAFEGAGTGVFASTTVIYPRSGVGAIQARRILFDLDTGPAVERVPSAPVGSVPAAQRDLPVTVGSGFTSWTAGAGTDPALAIDGAESTDLAPVVTWTGTPINQKTLALAGTPADGLAPIAAGDFSIEFLPTGMYIFDLTLTPSSVESGDSTSIAVVATATPDGAYPAPTQLVVSLSSVPPTYTFSGTPGSYQLTGSAGPDGVYSVVADIEVWVSGELVEIGTASADLTIDPAVAAGDPLAVAVLLDRSGSMATAQRWDAAKSAAQCFGELLAEDTEDHHVGIYWFSGDPSPAVDNAAVAQLGSSYGTVPGLDMVDADAPATDLTTDPGVPADYTSVGAGLMHARNRLVAGAPAGARRAILLLSDGMENRQPSMARVLTNGTEAGVDVTTADPSDPAPWVDGGDPNIDVYAVAIATTTSWVSRLETRLGEIGEPASQVTQVAGGKSAPIALHSWFLDQFTELAGLTACEVPVDPTLTEPEGVAEHPVQISTGHSRVVFNLFVEDDADHWSVAVRPPDRIDGTLEDSIGGPIPGVVFKKGPLYHTVIVDFPMNAPGFEHHWSGRWTFEVERTAAGEGAYAVSAITRGDVRSTFDVLEPVRPRTGDEVRLRAVLRDRDRPLRNAEVYAIASPKPYVDDAIARLTQGGSIAVQGEDLHYPHDVILAGAPIAVTSPAGSVQKVPMAEVAPGVYDGTFLADAPGSWDLHAFIDGHGPPERPKQPALVSLEHLEKLAVYFPPAHHMAITELARRRLVQGQPYHYELRRDVLVGFVPDWRRTRVLARLLMARGGPKLRLSVRPMDAAGRLLGPGWGHAIRFSLSGKAGLLPLADGGEGTYFVDASLRGRGLAVDRFRRVLTHPKLQLAGLAVPTGRLDLRHTDLSVLGHHARLPMRFSVAAPAKTEPVFIHDLHADLAKATKSLDVKRGAFRAALRELAPPLRQALRFAADPTVSAAQRAHAIDAGQKLASNLAEKADSDEARRFAATLYAAFAEASLSAELPSGSAAAMVGAQTIARVTDAKLRSIEGPRRSPPTKDGKLARSRTKVENEASAKAKAAGAAKKASAKKGGAKKKKSGAKKKKKSAAKKKRKQKGD